MVKKILFLLPILLIIFIPNLEVNAVQFATGGYSCVYFETGGSYCSPVTSFTYNNNSYYGANYSYDPDLLDVTGETVLDFNNQSFCSGQTTGGTITFRLYHNYDFEENPIDHVKYRLNNSVVNYCSTTYYRSGRYSDVTCNFPNSFTNVPLSIIYQFNDLGISFPFTAGVSNVAISENCGFSTSDVINNQNSNTQSIITNQNSNTQSIITNQDSNTQDIITNQNSNTQQEIESQKVCKSFSYGNDIATSNGYLTSSGTITSAPSWYHTTNYIPVVKNYTYNLTFTNYAPSSPSYCLYNSSKTLVSCSQYQNRSSIDIVPTVDGFIRYSLNTSGNNVTTFSGQVCSNGNQALDDSINSLNNSITSTDTPNTDQNIQDMNDMVASVTPITDLLTLPLTLINAYYSGIISSCSPYNFGNLLGTDIIFPCIDLEHRLGSSLWLIIDSLCSIFLIYSIAMLFVHAFDSLTSLNDNFENMYVPRHAGKHVGGGING